MSKALYGLWGSKDEQGQGACLEETENLAGRHTVRKPRGQGSVVGVHGRARNKVIEAERWPGSGTDMKLLGTGVECAP